MNSEVTALMVEPLSRRTQLFSPSILTQAMFLGPLQSVRGSGFRNGVFHDVFIFVESLPGILTEQQLASVKLNQISPALVQGSPFLHDHLPMNKIVSPDARTTALVIHL